MLVHFSNAPRGKKCVYSNAGYLLLTQVLEVVSGKSYEQLAKDELFDRVGADTFAVSLPSANPRDGRENMQLPGESWYWPITFLSPDEYHGAGTWVGSPVDLMRVNTYVTGQAWFPTMITSGVPLASGREYDLGLFVDVNDAGQFWHDGLGVGSRRCCGTATTVSRSPLRPT